MCIGRHSTGDINEFIENYQDNDFLNSYLNNNRLK